MRVARAEILSILRDRGNEPPALEAEALLSDPVDTERDRDALTRLGIGVGDLLKHYGGDASVTICGPAHGLS